MAPGQPRRLAVIKHANLMEEENKRWRTLCIAAAFEEDPHKLAQVVAEITARLSDRQQQLADQIFARLAEQPAAPDARKRWIH